MRILSTAAIAAFMAAGAVSAYSQTTAPAAKAKPCKGRAEADCQAPECVWVAATTTASGTQKKAYCRKPPKPKTTSTPPATKPN
jgi:hypothetical protein